MGFRIMFADLDIVAAITDRALEFDFRLVKKVLECGLGVASSLISRGPARLSMEEQASRTVIVIRSIL